MLKRKKIFLFSKRDILDNKKICCFSYLLLDLLGNVCIINKKQIKFSEQLTFEF